MRKKKKGSQIELRARFCEAKLSELDNQKSVHAGENSTEHFMPGSEQ